MSGIWFIKCPRCKNYMKKTDPEESCMCCACGWQEQTGQVFCEHIHNFCEHIHNGYYYDKIELELKH